MSGLRLTSPGRLETDMTEGDVKDQLLHSLGTLSAVNLVFHARLKAYDNPTGEQVAKVFKLTLADFERGLLAHITTLSGG